MRAIRDDDEIVVSRRQPERRLAYEIALGIWLGGVALAATSIAFWVILIGSISGVVKVG